MIENDIAKYERAVVRAKALGFEKYVKALEKVLVGLREIARLDKDFTSSSQLPT